MHISTPHITAFRKKIYTYFRKHKRAFPWRRDENNPYCVFISEVMLQQTQTDRTIEKYLEFVSAFPDFQTLAKAQERDVLRVWQGMGYNRRALYLLKSSRIIVEKYKGKLPQDLESLMSLPGIGPATARSIQAFGFNIPSVFIETNIRSVFIHEFFHDRTDVHDNDILPLLEKTLDKKNARKWYSALMDYGTMLKSNMPNPSRKSRHYTRQSKFEGSDRQVRGKILKILLQKACTKKELCIQLKEKKERCSYIVDKMVKEYLLKEDRGVYRV